MNITISRTLTARFDSECNYSGMKLRKGKSQVAQMSTGEYVAAEKAQEYIEEYAQLWNEIEGLAAQVGTRNHLDTLNGQAKIGTMIWQRDYLKQVLAQR